MREIRFEVRTTQEPYFVAPVGSIRTVSETVHVPNEVLLQLWRLTGSPEDVERFKPVLRSQGRDPHLGNVILHETERRISFVSKWARPNNSGEATFEALFGTLAWAEVLLRVRARKGHVHVRALDEDGEALRALFETIDDRFGDRFEVRLARFGELTDTNQAPAPPQAPLPTEDRELVEVALEMGYYDEPKGCGVRELGEALGLSKSAVSRRLRDLERRGLEALRDRNPKWPSEPVPPATDMSREG